MSLEDDLKEWLDDAEAFRGAHPSMLVTSSHKLLKRCQKELSNQRAKVLEAERYRFLRNADLESVHEGGVFAGRTPENIVLNGEDLDNAIDAAIKQLGE